MSDAANPTHFLLVEDDDDHAEFFRRAMKDAKLAKNFSHVADGEAALAYVGREPPFEAAIEPDVIILDLHLPKLNGLEVLRALKSDPATSDIPVVVMSTSDAAPDRKQAYEAHANSYLVKPMDVEKFHEMVRDLGLYWSVWNQRARDAA